MDLSDIPPLLLSEAGPVKLGPKHSPLVKLNPPFQSGKFEDAFHSFSMEYQELGELKSI